MPPTITTMSAPPGRGWGIAALIAVALPLPFLFTLNVLSLVIRSGSGTGGEGVVYGILAALGLLFLPLFLLLGLSFAIRAVSRPRVAGKVMGWIAISVVILAIPASWFGYLVWISPT